MVRFPSLCSFLPLVLEFPLPALPHRRLGGAETAATAYLTARERSRDGDAASTNTPDDWNAPEQG